MAGRKPKPTAIKKLEGNPGKRKLNTKEPIPAKGMPNCPEWLMPEAKKEWERLADLMNQMGVLPLRLIKDIQSLIIINLRSLCFRLLIMIRRSYSAESPIIRCTYQRFIRCETESASLEGRDCYAGLDLSSTGDITALVLIFPPRDEDEKFVLLPYFWIPEETIPRRVKANSVPYDIWEKQGYIMSTEGNVIHYDFIEKFIMDLSER